MSDREKPVKKSKPVLSAKRRANAPRHRVIRRAGSLFLVTGEYNVFT